MHIEPPPAPSSSRRRRTASARHLAGASALGLLAGAATAFCLPTPTYRATAIVQVPDAGASTRVATVNGAIAGAVSKPVMARAAASLLGAGVPVPPAGSFERLALALGAAGGRATGREDRLAGLLSASVVARPGAALGTVEVSAAMSQAEQAALAATDVAEAFVAEQDDEALEVHRRDERAAAARFEVLRAAAAAAHAKVAALEGSVATHAATAAADLVAATARRDAIARIIASGSPPLGEGKGMPAAVDALQTIYLDQVRQLAKARETLGDRHTTVVSLNEAVQRAAAALTAEWRRLKVAADADVDAGQSRQDAALKDGGAGADGVRQAALAAARGSAQGADAALARAEAAAADGVEARPYRVVVRAAVPPAASGLPPAARFPLALLAGLAAAALSAKVLRRAPPATPPSAPLRERVGEPSPPSVPRAAPVTAASRRVEPPVEPLIEPLVSPPPTPLVALDASVEIAELQAAIADLSTPSERTSDMPFLPPAPQPRDQDTLRLAMRDALPGLTAIEPRPGVPPTVLVAANEIGVTTMEAALALGHVAAGAGYRVLVIEGARPRTALATAADPDVDPILVDMPGGLRIALRAEGCAGLLFLAPCFTDGQRIAAALARSGEAPFVDDVADEFDLVVMDGGRAADRATEGWDLAVRVARFASERDDARFVATLDLPSEAFLGTLAGPTFSPRTDPAAPAVEAPAPDDQRIERASPALAVARPIAAHQLPRAYQPAHAQSSPSRVPHFTPRRRVGSR